MVKKRRIVDPSVFELVIESEEKISMWICFFINNENCLNRIIFYLIGIDRSESIVSFPFFAIVYHSQTNSIKHETRLVEQDFPIKLDVEILHS